MAHKVTKRSIKNTTLVFVGGVVGCKIIFNETGKIMPHMTKHMADLLLRRRHPWSVYAAVLYRNEQGENCTDAIEIHIREPIFVEEASDFIQNEHRELIASVNPEQIIGVAWLACPSDTVFDEEQSYKLFEKFGAFDKPTMSQTIK